MAKDDYYVMVYKILYHLYECLKKDVPINWNELKCNTKRFPVSEEYWQYVWRNLAKEELIEGVIEVPILGATNNSIKLTEDLMITPEGITYLEENSMMAKVKRSFRVLSDLVPMIF